MQAINKFFVEIHKANKQLVNEAWQDWQDYVADTLKADVEKAYPNGFKDYLMERLDNEISKAKADK